MSISGRFICRPCFYPRICKHPGRCTHWWDKPGVLQVWGAAEPSLLQLGVEMTSYKLFIYFLLLSFSLILLWYILNFLFFKALVFLRSHSGCVFSFYDIPTSVIEVWFFFLILKTLWKVLGNAFISFLLSWEVKSGGFRYLFLIITFSTGEVNLLCYFADIVTFCE